jgi:uncharacterized membrane protein (TIGR02234 family)
VSGQGREHRSEERARSGAPRGSEPESTVSSARRELTLAVVGTAAAGALALIAGGQTWARVVAERPAPLPPVESTLSGAEAVPLVPAAGLVLLAAAVALLAVRGVARVAVGLLAAVAGGVLIRSGLRASAGRLDTGDVRVSEIDVAAAWPLLAVGAGAFAVAAAGLVVLRGRSWPGMGRRYERTGGEAKVAARPDRTDEDRTQDAWKALDRGEDPTDPEPAPPRTRPV